MRLVTSLFITLAFSSSGWTQTPFGDVYCLGEPNSTGVRATLTAFGELDVTQNDLTLHARGLPPQALGYALISGQRDLIPLVGGGAGTLCLGPLFGRLSSQTVVASATGSADVPLDLTQLPSASGPFGVVHGETLRFQLWYRDTAASGGSTSNLTDGITVTFAPPPWFVAQEVFTPHALSTQLVDLDRDGDLDFVTCAYSAQKVGVHWNDGGGAFGRLVTIAEFPAPRRVVAADVDLDGITDVVVMTGTGTYTTQILRGRDGTSFEPPQPLNLPVLAQVVHADDVDNDGDVDFITVSVSSSTSRVDLFYGDGTGAFQQGPLLANVYADRVICADLDADSDSDLVLYGPSTLILIIRNLGSGMFGAPEPYSLAQNQYGQWVQVLDLDGDGLPDLASGGYGFVGIRLNRGDGTFGLEARYNALSFVRIVTAVDADGDGDLDLALESSSTKMTGWSSVSVMENRGSAIFTMMQGLGGEVPGTELRPCDLDGVGPLDLIGVDPWRHTLHASFDTGRLEYSVASADPWILVLSQRSVSWVTGDIDGDSDDEFVVMCRADDSSQSVYLALDLTPAGPRIIASWPMPSDAYLWKCTDFDGDGRSDFLYSRPGAVQVVLVGSSGQLTPAGPPLAIPNLQDITLGDFDADGDVDALAATPGASEDIRYFENTGSGTLVNRPGRVPLTQGTARLCYRIASGDVDGDGTVDLLGVAQNNTFVCWYPNLGNGSFGNRVEFVLPNYVTGLTVLDLEGDGDLDVLTERALTPRFALWNDGAGDFSTVTHWAMGGGGANAFAAHDIDGDGDTDLAALYDDEQAVQVILSTGQPQMAETFVVPWHGINPSFSRITLADLDGDRDCELIWIDFDYFIRISENHMR